jgi:hypothetical protein
MSNQPSAICYHATAVTGSQASGDNTHRKVKNFKDVPSVYLQVAGAVFAVFFLFLFFQNAEGFAREIMANFFMDATLSLL